MENNIEEINLPEYTKILIKNRNIILLCFFIGVLFSVAGIFLFPASESYKAEVIIKIGYFQDPMRSGNPTLIRSATYLVSEINSSFSQKYPSLNAFEISAELIRVSNSSSDKAEAEKGIFDVSSSILDGDGSIKKNIQEEINKLKIAVDKLRFQGQQAGEMNLRMFDLQDRLDTFTPSEIITQSTAVVAKGTGFTFYLVLGGFSGFLAGLAIVFSKEWWNKNRKKIT